tara:strand:+ start:431 stop:586 length:156 start_codon:yes stop_codon:yes gene_type:complete
MLLSTSNSRKLNDFSRKLPRFAGFVADGMKGVDIDILYAEKIFKGGGLKQC